MGRRRLDVAGALGNLPLFRQLAEEQLAAMVRVTQVVRASRGELLFNKGDQPTGLHVVMFGQVKLALSTSQGSEKVLELMGPGQSFGEAVLFAERPYPVNAECLADTLLLHVPKKALFDAIEADTGFARRMLGGLSFRLHELVGDVEAYSMRSAGQRLVGYLLSLAGEPSEQPATVTLPTSKHLVASRLNLTPETFSRILHQLTDAGLVSVDGRTVTILEPERLRAHV